MCIAQSGCSISKYMGYVLPAGKYGTMDSDERHRNYLHTFQSACI